MKAQLLPLDGGRPIEIRKDLVLVGRQSSCDLRIKHKTVSKLHCVLVKTDGLLLIRDLSSTNGCQVNGRRVTRAALLPNDVLGIANFRFRIQLGPDEVESPIKADERTEALDASDPRRHAGDSPGRRQASGSDPRRDSTGDSDARKPSSGSGPTRRKPPVSDSAGGGSAR